MTLFPCLWQRRVHRRPHRNLFGRMMPYRHCMAPPIPVRLTRRRSTMAESSQSALHSDLRAQETLRVHRHLVLERQLRSRGVHVFGVGAAAVLDAVRHVWILEVLDETVVLFEAMYECVILVLIPWESSIQLSK